MNKRQSSRVRRALETTALGKQLSQALRDEARSSEPSADAWNVQLERLRNTPVLAANQSRVRSLNWQVPVIATIVVAAIIVGAVTFTNSGATVDTGSPQPHLSPCSMNSTAEVAVPIDVSNGTSTGLSDQSSQPVGSINMFLLNKGAPPEGVLCGVFDGKVQISRSDQTLLGYISIYDAPTQDRTYLWGVIGPGIVQLQITAISESKQRAVDPGFISTSAWIVDSGKGTPWSLPNSATTKWSAVQDGWNGFVIEVPKQARELHIFGLGKLGAPLQKRVINVASSTNSDVPATQLVTTVTPTR